MLVNENQLAGKADVKIGELLASLKVYHSVGAALTRSERLKTRGARVGKAGLHTTSTTRDP